MYDINPPNLSKYFHKQKVIGIAAEKFIVEILGFSVFCIQYSLVSCITNLKDLVSNFTNEFK